MTHNRGSLARTRALGNTADRLSAETHFTVEENKSLLKLFSCMSTDTGKVEKSRFREFLFSCFDITHDVMLDLTSHAFDSDNDGIISDMEFVRGLSIIIRGEIDELTDFAYNAYDLNGDGSLGREELSQCLKGSLVPGYGLDLEDVDDAEKDLVEILMKKLDVNRDGQITKDDFQNAVRMNPLLLQSIGECLPTAKAMTSFLSLITEDYRSYTTGWQDLGHWWKSSKSSTTTTNYYGKHVKMQMKYAHDMIMENIIGHHGHGNPRLSTGNAEPLPVHALDHTLSFQGHKHEVIFQHHLMP